MFALPPLPPFTRRLLIVLAGFYLVEVILGNWVGIPLARWLALLTGDVSIATLWQVVSHPFAFDTGPTGVFSTLFALLFVWWMVSPVEQTLGIRKTVIVVVVATLGASLAAVVVGLLLREPDIVFGPGPILLAAIATLGVAQRGRQILFFGAFPMKADHMIWVAVGFSVLLFLTDKRPIQLVADLGAIGATILYLRYGGRIFRGKAKGKLRSVSGGQSPPRWMN